MHWGRDDVRGAFTPESSTFCHPAASPDGERPVAPAAELSVCARNIEAFSSAAFQLYAATDPLHFHTSALVQKEKGSCSVCLIEIALQLELAPSCAHGLGVSGAGCSRPIIICQSGAAGTINFPRCEIPEMAYPLSLDDPRAPLRTL